MKDFEEKLKSLNINDMHAPDNFEDLLRDSLNKVDPIDTNHNKFTKAKIMKVAALFLTILLVFNFQSVSAFFKSVLGYDEYFSYNTYINELNKENKLQAVNEELTFSNGKKVLIEGLLYDGLFVNLFVKEFDSQDQTVTINIINGEDRSHFYESTENNTICIVNQFLVKENSDSITVEFKLDDEVKYLDIRLDETKILTPIIIEPTSNNTLVIEDVNFTVNSIRLSALSIILDYSAISDNLETVNKIKNRSNDFFNEGINFNVSISGKGIDPANSYLTEFVCQLENGATFKENLHFNDLNVDKLKDIKIELTFASFAEKFTVDKPIKDTWINDELYIQDLSFLGDSTNSFNVEYWSIGYKQKNNLMDTYLMPKYSIQPIKGLYMSDKKPDKELLGANYKNFLYNKVKISKYDFDGNIRDALIIENKCYDIPKKDRTLVFKIIN